MMAHEWHGGSDILVYNDVKKTYTYICNQLKNGLSRKLDFYDKKSKVSYFLSIIYNVYYT